MTNNRGRETSAAARWLNRVEERAGSLRPGHDIFHDAHVALGRAVDAAVGLGSASRAAALLGATAVFYRDFQRFAAVADHAVDTFGHLARAAVLAEMAWAEAERAASANPFEHIASLAREDRSGMPSAHSVKAAARIVALACATLADIEAEEASS